MTARFGAEPTAERHFDQVVPPGMYRANTSLSPNVEKDASSSPLHWVLPWPPPRLRIPGSSFFEPQLRRHPCCSHPPATITQICLIFFMRFTYHPSYLIIHSLALQSLFSPLAYKRQLGREVLSAALTTVSPGHQKNELCGPYQKFQIHFGHQNRPQRTNSSATCPREGKMGFAGEIALVSILGQIFRERTKLCSLVDQKRPGVSSILASWTLA